MDARHYRRRPLWLRLLIRTSVFAALMWLIAMMHIQPRKFRSAFKRACDHRFDAQTSIRRGAPARASSYYSSRCCAWNRRHRLPTGHGMNTRVVATSLFCCSSAHARTIGAHRQRLGGSAPSPRAVRFARSASLKTTAARCRSGGSDPVQYHGKIWGTKQSLTMTNF